MSTTWDFDIGHRVRLNHPSPIAGLDPFLSPDRTGTVVQCDGTMILIEFGPDLVVWLYPDEIEKVCA